MAVILRLNYNLNSVLSCECYHAHRGTGPHVPVYVPVHAHALLQLTVHPKSPARVDRCQLQSVFLLMPLCEDHCPIGSFPVGRSLPIPQVKASIPAYVKICVRSMVFNFIRGQQLVLVEGPAVCKIEHRVPAVPLILQPYNTIPGIWARTGIFIILFIAVIEKSEAQKDYSCYQQERLLLSDFHHGFLLLLLLYQDNTAIPAAAPRTVRKMNPEVLSL